MKKIIWLFVAVLIVSCKSEQNDFVTLNGKLKTSGVEKLLVQGKDYSKEILVSKDGSFSDTLKVLDGVYAISNGNDRLTLFLKNGYNLNVNFKGEKLSDGALFNGNGAETNSFIENKRMFYVSEDANPKTYFKLDKEEYEAKLTAAKSLLKSYKDDAPNLDSIIGVMDARNDQMFFRYVESNYEKVHENLLRFAKGTSSPEFVNYENFNGGTTSLSDLKGKYVYIDVWATWCKPCKDEIPSLKILENDFHGKNIEFVSISVDKLNAYETWKKMVKDLDLKGVQLFADNNFESDFITAYGINSIPRFILLDPEGNIVDANANRPSNPELRELLLELGI
ncbi:TlpA family protein disulfide reductase [Lutibacter flavus]|uniref:Thiol-disulfide isomerase or thioredoxin n=1 Tax=Lutibacter flavus TaxID=691689 RepID=A0A238XNG3_9FLAO|nr:TlpA disulfide reductase family protein [Lutibacter flavus]SNR60091.1 Thiol-disulfide isomerase or thioredoxin [Lutibacter flavus]